MKPKSLPTTSIPSLYHPFLPVIMIFLKMYIVGVEKLNDDCRRIHLQQSNKWDAAKDVLMVGKRIKMLGEFERTKQQYKKADNNYWAGGITESRAKRPRFSNDEESQESRVDEIDRLTPEMIKARLTDLGFKTRAKKLKRLQEIYRAALQSVSNEQT